MPLCLWLTPCLKGGCKLGGGGYMGARSASILFLPCPLPLHCLFLLRPAFSSAVPCAGDDFVGVPSCSCMKGALFHFREFSSSLPTATRHHAYLGNSPHQSHSCSFVFCILDHTYIWRSYAIIRGRDKLRNHFWGSCVVFARLQVHLTEDTLFS